MRKLIVRLMQTLCVAALLMHCAVVAAETDDYSKFRQQTYQVQQAYLKRLAEHHGYMMHDMERKLSQQEWQTTAISVMVMVMVGFGLVLSALQFYADWRQPNRSPITLKLGAGSVEINSSVIGIVILGLSFWFFQTYVSHVYDIKAIPLQPIDATQYGRPEIIVPGAAPEATMPVPAKAQDR
jgi:hypothetical protein